MVKDDEVSLGKAEEARLLTRWEAEVNKAVWGQKREAGLEQLYLG